MGHSDVPPRPDAPHTPHTPHTLGALFAGGVPVPLYPPSRPSQLEDHLNRIAGILLNARARVLVTVGRAKPLAHLLRAQVKALRSVVTVVDLSQAHAAAPSADV